MYCSLGQVENLTKHPTTFDARMTWHEIRELKPHFIRLVVSSLYYVLYTPMNLRQKIGKSTTNPNQGLRQI